MAMETRRSFKTLLLRRNTVFLKEHYCIPFEMDGDFRLAASAEYLERSTRVIDHEREALAATQSFSDLKHVFSLLATVDTLGSRLHKTLVDWHTRYPDKPKLEETDNFWADLKELRAAKEQLNAALEAIKARERRIPTMRSQLEQATTEVGDVERFLSSYLDRINEK
jgi:prefoldin subunit 5